MVGLREVNLNGNNLQLMVGPNHKKFLYATMRKGNKIMEVKESKERLILITKVSHF
jgi:hypothetical protein